MFLFWFRGLENQSWYTKVVKVVIYQWFMRFWFGVANIAQTNKNRGCKLLKRFAQNKFSKNYDELMERVYEIKGMKEAGWELTQKGNYYYKDEDHDNVIHLSY